MDVLNLKIALCTYDACANLYGVENLRTTRPNIILMTFLCAHVCLYVREGELIRTREGGVGMLRQCQRARERKKETLCEWVGELFDYKVNSYRTKYFRLRFSIEKKIRRGIRNQLRSLVTDCAPWALFRSNITI